MADSDFCSCYVLAVCFLSVSAKCVSPAPVFLLPVPVSPSPVLFRVVAVVLVFPFVRLPLPSSVLLVGLSVFPRVRDLWLQSTSEESN